MILKCVGNAGNYLYLKCGLIDIAHRRDVCANEKNELYICTNEY